MRRGHRAARPLAVAFCLALGISLASRAADGKESLADIQAILSDKPVVCAEFIQRKHLRALSRPLVSKGRLVFISGRGLLWQVRQPIASKVLLDERGLVRWNEDGTTERLDLGQVPVFRALTNVFLGVFSGDLKGLEDAFQVGIETGTESAPSGWRLDLVPREPDLAAMIARIGVLGNRYVDALSIHERHGDRMDIQFANMEFETCHIGAAETDYLAR